MPDTKNEKLHQYLAVIVEKMAMGKEFIAEALGGFRQKAEALFQGRLIRRIALDTARSVELDGEEYAPLQTTVHAKMQYVYTKIADALDVSATIDATNGTARADMIINGVVVAVGVPAKTLLLIEDWSKEWIDLEKAAPTLALGVEWIADPTAGDHIMKTAKPAKSHKFEKTFKFVVMVPATDKHPAQIEKFQPEAPVTNIETTTWSGMLSTVDKASRLEIVQAIQLSAKEARQRANETPVVRLTTGQEILKLLLNGLPPRQ